MLHVVPAVFLVGPSTAPDQSISFTTCGKRIKPTHLCALLEPVQYTQDDTARSQAASMHDARSYGFPKHSCTALRAAQPRGRLERAAARGRLERAPAGGRLERVGVPARCSRGARAAGSERSSSRSGRAKHSQRCSFPASASAVPAPRLHRTRASRRTSAPCGSCSCNAGS